MFLGSFLLHALAFLLSTYVHTFLPAPIEEPVYYVDVVNLPVASPRAGSPTPGKAPETVAPVAPPEQKAPMTLPAKQADKAKTKNPAPAKQPTQAAPGGKAAAGGDEAARLDERMKQMEQRAEAKHEEAALEALQRKHAGGGRAGMPAGTGTQAGSDYGSYLQSRLRDALAQTIAYQSRRPETAVRLVVDRNGKLVRTVMERSSRDPLFNDAVMRAIEKAKASFPPPPNGKEFEKLFVFSPEEVSKR
ncbi:energy transducer TonB [Geobacter argillaceus]|uniref:Cell division and transport-associated protein TolA n=1 Tax=Geobacter argillaceus TaxID=345631 RepID=A0A562VNM2_9BACT|nr:TonB family protein [Geobacter argillaceus]TWJ19500.1 cell division and transport-associated protein TolA [Geobacter argillaceus]